MIPWAVWIEPLPVISFNNLSKLSNSEWKTDADIEDLMIWFDSVDDEVTTASASAVSSSNENP